MSTILPFSINVNTSGIPALSSLSVSVSTTQVSYDFNNHRNVGAPFRGIIVVRLQQPIPTGTTGTLPVVFTSGGGSAQPLTGYNGDAITVADLPGSGIFLVWWDNTSNTLQLLTGIV